MLRGLAEKGLPHLMAHQWLELAHDTFFVYICAWSSSYLGLGRLHGYLKFIQLVTANIGCNDYKIR